MEGTEKSETSYYSLSKEIDSQFTHHVVALEKVAEYHIFTNALNAILFQVISDLVNDFIKLNFNALKIILKIHKKIIKRDPGLILTQGNLLVA